MAARLIACRAGTIESSSVLHVTTQVSGRNSSIGTVVQVDVESSNVVTRLHTAALEASHCVSYNCALNVAK